MRNTINTYINESRRDRRKQLKIAAVLAALALLVGSAVYWHLRSTGLAMTNEVFCGLEEHAHDRDCYDGEALICGLPEHTHTVDCLMDDTADVETADVWEATLPRELSGVWADDLVSVAESQIGYAESRQNFRLADDGATHTGYTRYGAWYGNAYGAWDAMFVSFCLHYAGIPDADTLCNSGARAMSVALNESGLYVEDESFTPEAGNLVFFDADGDEQTDRVGIVTQVGEDALTVIEGDCGDTVAENICDPQSGQITGYGLLPDRPDTAEETVTCTAGSGGVEVTVTVPADALPLDAQLQVVLYDEGSDEYEKALSLTENAADPGGGDQVSAVSGPGEADTVEKAEEEEKIPLSFGFSDPEDTESGAAVMDIFFLSGGEEVEPDSNVDVTIDASGLLASCENPAESLEVWHLAETEDGTEPVLVADISDPDAAADGVAAFTVDSFSEFEFHYTCSAGGWAGFGTNLFDGNGNTLSATVSGGYAMTGGRYTTTVDMPYTFTLDEFAEHFTFSSGTYGFRYATVTDPNYGDTEHTFDIWPDEEQVGADALYGSRDNPVVSVTIDGTSAADNPNYGSENIVSKTWHFTLTYKDGDSVTIPIYGNADGANDGGGKYCPQYLELNLYFEEGKEVVLNLGNGNGTYSDGDYTGSNASGGDALRYGTGDLNDYVNDGTVTVNLPSDDDLNTEFTVVDATGNKGEEGYQPEVTITLGKEQAYDYKLTGWINIATGAYYDVSEGAAAAEVDLSDDNVFYADWIAASYDHGSSSDDDLKKTVSTSSFVTFDLFDYNELFNLYSVKLEQNGTGSEEWTDSESMYTTPLLGGDADSLDRTADSFIFQNSGTTRGNVHVLSHANPVKWNLWTANAAWADDPEYNFVLDAGEYWDITEPDSTVLGMLYDKKEESLGVHYVGSGDYLFWVDEDGYYTYDSAVSGAAYNQSEGRFYVYEDNANAFFPYNDHTEAISSSNGLTDYWFGMAMDVTFYLPNSTASGSEDYKVNQVNDNDMIFDFSGDDDIMIFVDGKMVVDMAGIHSTSYSRINFSTNTVTYSMGLDDDGAPDTSGGHGKYYVNESLNLSAGFHTLTVRYMERGAGASNLKIQFNVAPTWEYDSWPVQTVTAEKVWQDSDGNVIDPEDLPDVYKTGVQVGLFDVLGPEIEPTDDTDGVFGYTKDGNEYTVVYTDDKGYWHQYVFTKDEKTGNENTLTYTEGHYAETGDPVTDTSVTYSNTDEDGKVLDSDGYVIAWLEEDDLLHIRIDEQTLSGDDNWKYAWELLDAGGDYETLELSGSSSYVTTSEKEDLTEYNYWSIIGESEIEQYLRDPDSYSDFRIILTEAAQETTDTLGDTQEALGWVIVATADGSLSAQQVKFSHYAQLFEVGPDGETEEDPDDTEPGEQEPGGEQDPGDTEPGDEEPDDSRVTYYYSLLGVTSVSEIDALGSGAVWYLVDSGNYIEKMGNAEEFYLYCLIDGDEYYLAMNEEGNSLIVTMEPEEASLFYYDFLGELRIVREADAEGYVDGRDRVVIAQDGTISLAVAEDVADENDVRFYTLTETETTGFSFTAVNIFLPDLTLEKTDRLTGYPLAGVSFTLMNGEGQYYAGLNEATDQVTWSEEPYTLVTDDENGQIVFRYMADGTYTLTEIKAADGYDMLPSAILITIKTENGVVKVTAGWASEDVDQKYNDFISVSGNGLVVTVENQPGAELPNTGGPGTWFIYMIGGAMSAGAAVVLIRRRRING